MWENNKSEGENYSTSHILSLPNTLLFVPKQIRWGQKSEPKARTAYVGYMRSHGHPNLSASDCVHSEKDWLGASPDARVYDLDCTDHNGIAEFKCPFSKADVHVETACEDPLFFTVHWNQAYTRLISPLLPSSTAITLHIRCLMV